MTWPESRDPYKIWHTLKDKISEKGRGLGHVTLEKFGMPSKISPKQLKLPTSNLAHACMWTISPKWTNKISEKGRGLGQVTLKKFGTPSKISPKQESRAVAKMTAQCAPYMSAMKIFWTP